MRKYVFPPLLASFVVAICATVSAQISSDFTIEESRSLAVVPDNGVRRAFLVSTGRHINKRITPLDGVDSDVDLIRERLLDPRCGFQDENVVVLKTDDYPTLENITAALDAFLDSCGPNDFAFLYLGGHGVRDPKTNVDYYVPFDAKPIIENGRVVAFDGSTCFSLKTLKEKIEGCDAKFKWIVVDACRENLDAKGVGDDWNSIGRLEAAEGSLLFQSCGIGSQSWEILVDDGGEKVKHGMFTWFFCQGAKGAAANEDGLISPIGLFKYARSKMREARKRDRKVPEQEPLMSCQDLSDAEFVFVDASDAEEVRAAELYNEALQFFLKGEIEQARTKIDEAVKLRAENETYQNLKARVDALIKEKDVKEKERQVQTHVAQGWKYYAEKDYSNALKEANSALKLDPTNAGALTLKKQSENPPQVPPKSNPLPNDYLASNGAEYRLIKAGSFMMGSPLSGEEVVKKYPTSIDAKFFNVPQHKVTLTQDFYLGKYPVTRGEFKRFVEATGYKTTAEKEGSAYTLSKDGSWEDVKGASWKNPGFEQTDRHPVVCVSYDDALAYIAWLNKSSKPEDDLNGLKPTYRLPTEAEWEYACRAGTKTEFFWGDDEEDGKGYLNATGKDEGYKYSFSFVDGYTDQTSPVGSFKPNPWGLYDMLGEVCEWTSDWYEDYPNGSVTDPKGATSGSYRVLRGGSWLDSPASCRCACRGCGAPEGRDARCGMRVALSLTSK